MPPLRVSVLLFLASLCAGIPPQQIKNLVTFGDSYTDVNPSSDGGTAWPIYASFAYANLSLYPYAQSGAVCSNNLTSRSEPSLFESQLPVYFAEDNNRSLPLTPQETLYSLWIGTNDLGANGLLTGNVGETASLVAVADCMVNWVRVLYKSGARNFLFQNVCRDACLRWVQIKAFEAN